MSIIQLEDFENIKKHSAFDKELTSTMQGYTKIPKFQKWFLARLMTINEAVDLSFLTEGNGYYGKATNSPLFYMRYKSKEKNARILFSVDENNSAKILLCAFLEKSKSDYDIAIKELKKGFKVNEEGKCDEYKWVKK